MYVCTIQVLITYIVQTWVILKILYHNTNHIINTDTTKMSMYKSHTCLDKIQPSTKDHSFGRNCCNNSSLPATKTQ